MNKARSVLIALVAATLPFAAMAQKTTTKGTAAPAVTMKIAPVNVNTATVAELETLPGIGPKIAADIVKNRPYKDSKELEAKVKGIGPKVWTKIEKYVLFK